MADVDITSLSVEISAESQGAELNINKLATAISNLRTKGNVTKVVNSLDRLSASISALKSASAGLSGLDKLTGFLDKLSGTDLSASAKSINSVGNAIKKIAAVDIGGLDLSGLSGKMSELQSGLSPLAGLDVSGLKGIGSAINALGKIPSLTNKLDSSTLDAFAKACEKISTSLTPLASQLDKVGNAFAKLPPQLSKVVTQANRVTAANEKQRKSYLSLSNQMNGFMRNMAKLVSLKAIADYLGNAVAKFNDFYEATDLFHNAMGNLSGEADTLISKMQGLLGVDPTKAMTYMATIQSLGTSFGLASDKAYVLSKNLTQLAYDEASYWNKNVTETFTAMSSAISGEIEPIRRLGVDLTQARLQQELLTLGFNKQVSSLSQADKAVLRYIAIMKQTANIQGNLAQTINSPANQIKILKAQLDMLAKSVGSLLYPALKSILPPLIAAVQLIREFVEWVAKLMGIKVVFTDFSKSADSVGGIGDAMDDTADSTKKAAKALKDYTMGFDELNIIDPTQGSSGSGSGASAGNILGDVDLSGYDMFASYVGTQIDKVKEKVRELLPLIGTVTAAFALWEISKFLGQLAEAVKNLTTMQRTAAMIAIIAIEWVLVQKYSDDFLKTGNTNSLLKGWLTTMAATVGGYVLFGAEGATLALSVSALVQLESIKTGLETGKVQATDASVWVQAISTAITTGLAGAVFTKSAIGFEIGLPVGAVLALTTIAYSGVKGGSIKAGDAIDGLLTALTGAAGGLAGVSIALATGAAAPVAGAALIAGVGVGIVLEQMGVTFAEKGRIKEIEDYIKRYEEAGYTTLAIHYRLKNLGFSGEEVQMAEDGIDSTFEILRYTFNKKLEALNDWFSEKWAGFKENFSKAWNSLGEAVSSAEESLNQASADLKQWFVGVGEWWGQKWAGFKENWDKAWNSLVDTVKNIPKKMLEYGKNIVDGLIKGINQGIENAKKTVGGLAKAIIDKFTGDLDINSPSKVFFDYGSYIVQGLANGITGSLGYVNDVMNQLVDATKLKGEEMVNYGIDCGTSYVNGIISGLDSKWTELDNNLKTNFFGTVQTFIQAAQSGDWKQVGTTIAASIWGAMGDEQRKRVKSVANDLLGRLGKELKIQASSLLNTAATIGKNLVSSLTQNFGAATENTAKMVENITSVFTKAKTPLSTAALAISKGLSGGLLSQFPKMLAGVAGLITTIGGAFTAMLEAIGGTLSVLGIPTGFAMVAGGIAIAAAIAGIIGSISRSNYSDSSQYAGTSSYDSTYGSGSYSSTYSAASGNSEAMRDAVYNGCYNAFLDIWQRYGEEISDGRDVKVYLDGKQLTASVEKTQKARGMSIMGTEVYSY